MGTKKIPHRRDCLLLYLPRPVIWMNLQEPRIQQGDRQAHEAQIQLCNEEEEGKKRVRSRKMLEKERKKETEDNGEDDDGEDDDDEEQEEQKEQGEQEEKGFSNKNKNMSCTFMNAFTSIFLFFRNVVAWKLINHFPVDGRRNKSPRNC